MQPYRLIIRCLFCAILPVLVPACEKTDNTDTRVQENTPPPPPASTETFSGEHSGAAPGTPQTQFNIGNKSYLFDISEHTIGELESLLLRTREITELDMREYPDLEIVMIIHGPDIDWFTRQNQERNRELVDLAAKLDALEIIDMKVCEKTMQGRGIKPDDIPAFIEPVPYAPDEIKRLNKAGYINL